MFTRILRLFEDASDASKVGFGNHKVIQENFVLALTNDVS